MRFPLKVTAPVEPAVASCSDNVLPLPFTVPVTPIVPLPLFKVVSPANVNAAKFIAVLVVLIVPKVVVVPAVLVKPPVKVSALEPALPKVTPPVLLKVVALVMVLVPVPFKATA